MHRFFRNAGVLLKWLLLVPFLLIKGYFWLLFIVPFKYAIEQFELPQSWEAFESVMRTKPCTVFSGAIFGVGLASFFWVGLVVMPYLFAMFLYQQ
jgi:hypothetical protein